MVGCPICHNNMELDEISKSNMHYICKNCRKQLEIENINLGFYRRIYNNKWQIYSASYDWQYIDKLNKQQQIALRKLTCKPFIFR